MPLLIFLYHDSVVLRGFEPTGKGCGDSAEAWNSVWMQQMLQDLGPMTRFLSAIPAVLLGLAEAWNLERMFLQAFSVAVHLSNPLLSMPFHVAAMKKLIGKKKHPVDLACFSEHVPPDHQPAGNIWKYRRNK